MANAHVTASPGAQAAAPAAADVVERFDAHGPRVVAYCIRVCGRDAAPAAVEQAFRSWLAGGEAEAPDDERLLRATRAAAAAHAAPGIEPPAAPRGGFLRRIAAARSSRGNACALMPELLAARESGELSPADQTRVTQHLRSCVACRSVEQRFRNAEQAFATPSPADHPTAELRAAVLSALGVAADALGDAPPRPPQPHDQDTAPLGWVPDRAPAEEATANGHASDEPEAWVPAAGDDQLEDERAQPGELEQPTAESPAVAAAVPEPRTPEDWIDADAEPQHEEHDDAAAAVVAAALADRTDEWTRPALEHSSQADQPEHVPPVVPVLQPPRRRRRRRPVALPIPAVVVLVLVGGALALASIIGSGKSKPAREASVPTATAPKPHVVRRSQTARPHRRHHAPRRHAASKARGSSSARSTARTTATATPSTPAPTVRSTPVQRVSAPASTPAPTRTSTPARSSPTPASAPAPPPPDAPGRQPPSGG